MQAPVRYLLSGHLHTPPEHAGADDLCTVVYMGEPYLRDRVEQHVEDHHNPFPMGEGGVDERRRGLMIGLHKRWLVLLLSSFMMVGSYYCYDNPSALNEQLEDYFTNGPAWKLSPDGK